MTAAIGAPPGNAAAPAGRGGDDLLGGGSGTDSTSAVAFQPMPALSAEQRQALADDIRRYGVQVPITVDQHGRILDGNNRAEIAAELGIDCPRTVVQVIDDDDAYDRAVTLNCARRHLTREQVREIIDAELSRRWADSDRAIARRVGCSPTTVGTVRAERRAEAERITEQIDRAVAKTMESIMVAAVMMHRGMDGSVQVGQPMCWQAIGDLLERTSVGRWRKEWPDDEITDAMMVIFGPFFDSIRATRCDEACPFCDPVLVAWAAAHPKQVYRHTEPSTEVPGDE